MSNIDRKYDLLNLTGHKIVLTDGWKVIELPSSDRIRVKGSNRMVERVVVDGFAVPLLETVEESVEGLPEEQEGRLLIVSGVVGGFMKGKRGDLVVPSRVSRDKKLNVSAARALMRIEKGDG